MSASDIRKTERGGKAAYLNIGAWFDAETGHIHLIDADAPAPKPRGPYKKRAA